MNSLLHLVLVGATIADAASNFLKCTCGDGIDCVASGEVALDLLAVGERSFE
jgi:hypothetical protein